MAQVFLSYDREDAAKARVIAQALERAGHFVWWDLHIKGGAEYGKVIEQALDQSDAVVVLWSERSIASAWVRDEAAAGRDKGSLIPVLLETVSPPMGFRQYQNIDFSSWKGRGRPPHMADLLSSIEALGRPTAAPPQQSPQAAKPATSPRRRWPKWPALSGIAVLLLVVIGFVLAKTRQPPATVVAIAAAEQSAGSKSLARDLFVKLGALQAARPNALELVESNGSLGRAADLILEAGSSSGNGLAEANLVLMAGKDRSLLWSRDFEQPAAQKADLEQQVAYTAALVLQCGSEAMTAGSGRIDQPTLKLYLIACADFSNLHGVDPRALVPAFEAVVKSAPRFEGAWAKLLVSESEWYVNPDFGDARIALKLKRDIVAARRLNPHMAEAYLAEAEMLPSTDFLGRMKLFDEAVAQNPDNPVALGARAQNLMHVGRMRDAIADAERAVQLDPISPAWRDSLVSTLTYTGQFEHALAELEKAERFWPGASNLLSARYRLMLRYGDPNEALRILNSGKISGLGDLLQRSFLEARIDQSPASIDRALSLSRGAYQRYPQAIAIHLQGLAEFNREAEVIADLTNWRYGGEANVASILFRPTLRELHHDPRFMAIANRLGLVRYWQKSGKWPDFCFEPHLPYDCKAEAAKLS